MKIYTKTGDKGETGLFGGGRVWKHHPRIVAYGDVDELNAWIGWARSMNEHEEVDVVLKKIQNDLFDVGALLATPDKKKLEGKATSFIRPEDISYLEAVIDRLEQDLPPLKTFILPGGSSLASSFQIARTICRRAEREIVALTEKEFVEEEIIEYMNRLSDLLFVLARWGNLQEEVPEPVWEKK
ncbi:MAG: cob(I)yrinic acid a,c-diamide adenosyltransferase [Deltaproteobacteria bacterium]|nr:cob(I)yrinic acid a,c-diamide adenosyltransferase [Deltaproteobacteria bacterium]